MSFFSRSILKDWLKIFQSLGVIIGLIFGAYQLTIQTNILKDNRKINSANFILKVSDELNKSEYDKIREAIDNNNNGYPICRYFTDYQIDGYIGNFETLGNLAHENIVLKKMVYNELGYEIEKAWCNKDIQSYIREIREKDNNFGPEAFYIGFQELAEFSLSRDKINHLDDTDNKY